MFVRPGIISRRVDRAACYHAKALKACMSVMECGIEGLQLGEEYTETLRR